MRSGSVQLMMESSSPWELLFPPSPAGAELHLRLARKRGDALLLIPTKTALARRALTLYPAQTSKARMARALLWLAPVRGTEPVVLTTEARSDFAQFLARTAGTRSLPEFAMLLGNPRAPGRRFVLLLFDDSGFPTALVKAGTGNTAQKLIAAELEFLRSQPTALLHSPRVLGEFESGNTHAFAMELLQGRPPRPGSSAQLVKLLYAWLRERETVNCLDLPAMRRLRDAIPAGDSFSTILETLRSTALHPVIHHGDFAPWNVREDAFGQWRVLDWERGEAQGPPAWDWFHWVIQHEVLVRRADTEQLFRGVTGLLESAEFQAYAKRAGIVGIERGLLTAYLLYCTRVIRQADGLPAIEQLLRRLMQ
jgi:hypothetical protein